MNVLIIAEDPIKDQHVLKPIIGAMLNYLGRGSAKVAVHQERFFEPLAKQFGVFDEPGNGRQPLGEQAAKQYAKKLRVLCKEDLLALEDRVRNLL